MKFQSFGSDAKIFRLVSEAYRISAAHLIEPFLAVRLSLIEPLPHQISAVYEKMLPRQPLRFVLADDPGAGKTVMTGLLIKELILRGDVRRCLIVCPGALAEQWQDELQQKFQLAFEILTSERITSAAGNIFADVNRCIASVDTLARSGDFKGKLGVTDWDLIVCDEAHKMSASVWSNEVKYTKRFQLGQLLGKITRHFLLLTATPHNGKEKDFYLFMSLIDPDRFEGAKRITAPVDVSDIMRRLVKEDLRTFEGKPLFPERRAYSVNYSLSREEMKLYELVTAYVADGFDRAERLTGDKKVSVGFAMTILQRRLASSPRAIYKSLARRTERLQKILSMRKFPDAFDDENFDDDFPSGELERAEDELSERATPSRTWVELRNEIRTLQQLTEFAKKIFISGDDRKWRELSALLQDEEKFSGRDKWTSLDGFQKTRGALRVMAKVIYELWTGNDKSLLIMPSTIPLYADTVRDELTKILGGNWDAIVNGEVDGEGSKPAELDAQNLRYGRLNAARKIARTIFMGTAPGSRKGDVRGLEDNEIRLATVQPHEVEQISVYNNALTKLKVNLYYLYSQGSQLWFGVNPTLRKFVDDKREQFTEDDVIYEIEQRLKRWRERGAFKAVHICPKNSDDVPDEQTARLVILSPKYAYEPQQKNAAFETARTILDTHGAVQRRWQNMLLFMAADAENLRVLKNTVREFMAWRDVNKSTRSLNLDTLQLDDAKSNLKLAEENFAMCNMARQTCKFLWRRSCSKRRSPKKFLTSQLNRRPIRFNRSRLKLNRACNRPKSSRCRRVFLWTRSWTEIGWSAVLINAVKKFYRIC